jgi:hypothetical protein
VVALAVVLLRLIEEHEVTGSLNGADPEDRDELVVAETCAGEGNDEERLDYRTGTV